MSPDSGRQKSEKCGPVAAVVSVCVSRRKQLTCVESSLLVETVNARDPAVFSRGMTGRGLCNARYQTFLNLF